MLSNAVEDARSRWDSAGLDYGPPEPSDQTIVERIKSYDASMDILLPIGAELGRWTKQEHYNLVCETLESVSQRLPARGSYYPLWRELARYPATTLLYAIGLSGLKADNIELLGRILSVPIRADRGEDEPTVSELMPMCLIDRRESLWPLFEGQRRYTPMSDWLEARMRAHFSPNTSGDDYNDPFTQLFDQWEMLAAIAYRALVRRKRSHVWVPIGCWGWRRSVKEGILERLGDDLTERKNGSKLMRLGLFADADEAKEVLAEVLEFAGQVRMW